MNCEMATKHEERQMLLVWGFVRNIQQMYKSLIIPLEINDIIYLYQTFCDEWSKKYSHPNAIIDETQTNVKFIMNKRQTAFGDFVVKQGGFQWKLQIISFNKTNGNYYPCVGVIEDDVNYTIHQQYSIWDEVGYQLCAGNSDLNSLNDNEYISDSHTADNYECEWKNEGDILEIILDLDQRTLRFAVNGKDCGIAFRDVKQTSYRLALTTDVDAEFQLL